jgi:hypothetical protein
MEDASRDLVAGKPIYDYFSAIMRRDRVKLLCLLDIDPPVIAGNFDFKRPGSDIRQRSLGCKSHRSPKRIMLCDRNILAGVV